MSLPRRIALVFLIVNGVTLGLLSLYVGIETSRVRDDFETAQQRNRGSISRAMALIFKRLVEDELETSLAPGMRDDTVAAMMAISDQAFWDEDELVRVHLDKAVLVRWDEGDTVLFNPRPRFIFEEGAIDRNAVRNLVVASGGVGRSAGGEIVYGTIDLESDPRWGFYFRIRGSSEIVDPTSTIRNVLLITFPGSVLLLGVLFYFLHRQVLRPIAAIEEVALRIAADDYDETVPSTGRDDELGRLAEAMNRMIRQLRNYRSRMEGLVSEATDRFKNAERHLVITQRLAATGQLAAGIAHEINNPLGGIMNAVARLSRADVTKERREKYHAIAEDGLARIVEIVKKVLATTPHDVAIGPVRLAEVIARAEGLLAHRLRKERIELTVDVEAVKTVLGDANELAQVFLNLFINACDAIEDGGTISVVAREISEGIEVRVADSGSGIPEDVRPQVFDLFFTTKAGGEGTGLGLGIVHNIVTGHGGSIAVESETGKGTTLIITLPR